MPASIFSRFMRGIFSTGLGRLTTLVLGMASLMLVVRHISADAYGMFVFIRVICVFLAEVTNLGLTAVIPKYLAASEDVQYKCGLINTVIYFRIVTVVVCGLLMFTGRPVLLALFGSSPLLRTFFVYVPILFGLESVARTLMSILQGLFRFRIIGIISTLSAAANFIATLVCIFPLNLSTIGLIYALFVSDTVIIILAYSAANIKDKAMVNLPTLKGMLRFGWPLQMQYILDFVFARIDTVVIGVWLGTTSVAFYEVARKLPDSIMYLFDAFQSVYFSFVSKFHAEGSRNKVAKLLSNSTRVLSFLTSLAALGAVLFGKQIISLLFSQAYLPSYYAFVVLMFGLNLSVLDSILGSSLVAIGEPTKPLIVNGIRAIINVLLNIVIIPTFNFLGAAVVTVVSNFIAAPLDTYFLGKRNIRAEILTLFKPVIIAGGYGLLFVSVGTSLAYVKVVFIVIFILTCQLMSIITRDDRQIIVAEAISLRNRLWGRETGECVVKTLTESS
jgi:O-antigen/teichoic acid export membrane protein